MSELQIGLIALGVLLILLVLGFNWWQDRRAHRRMQARFPVAGQDPLFGGQTEAPAKPAADIERREPGITAPGTEPVAVATPPVVELDDAEEPDAACEVVIEIHFNEPVSGSELANAVRSVTSLGSKPVRVFASTDRGRHRARLSADESYSSLQLAVLLANRSGPLTAIEWSQIWARAQGIADRFDSTIEGPDQQVVVERATKLDEFCANLDAQVGLTLVLEAPRSAGEVTAVAREIGFVTESDRFAWLAENGSTRFTLSRGDAGSLSANETAVLDRLVLLLDVPRSPEDPRAFGRMVDVGRALAGRLQAQLVDDQGKVVVDGMSAGIDEQLQTLFRQLDQAGMPAASERALRVFA